MSEFIRKGDRIVVKPQGLDYELKNGKVYDLKWDGYDGVAYLEENGELNMPKKLYELPEDNSFINRILNFYNSDIAGNTTGVLLSGIKGTGKTVLSKRLAIESGLPIIVVDPNFWFRELTGFFKDIKNAKVCLIFDEIEKNPRVWDTEALLGFLDGVQATCKKLCIMTCNKMEKLDENLIDRCSRIRYLRKYEANSNEVFIRDMAIDKGIKNIDLVANFIKDNMRVLSFDNIASFIDEIVLYQSEEVTLDTLTETINLMNISTKSQQIMQSSIEEDEDSVIIDFD